MVHIRDLSARTVKRTAKSTAFRCLSVRDVLCYGQLTSKHLGQVQISGKATCIKAST